MFAAICPRRYDGGTFIAATVSLPSALSTALLQLTYRTQGLQLYRDGSFFLCTLFMNNIISKEEYVEQRERLLDDSISLIREELPLIEKIRKAQAATVSAGGAAAAATAASGSETSASAPGTSGH